LASSGSAFKRPMIIWLGVLPASTRCRRASIDVDAMNFTHDAAIEALGDAVGLRCSRLSLAILRAERGADLGEG